MRRVVFILLPLVLVASLTACERQYPYDERWPNGMYVHPHFMPPPPPEHEHEMASCWIGMNDLADATVWSWLNDPGLENEEEWSWWFYSDFLGGVADRSSCLAEWPWERQVLRHNYACGYALVPYFGSGTEGDMLFFRTHFLCDATAHAYLPIFCDCIPFGLAADSPPTPTPEAQQAMALGFTTMDPTGQFLVDPSNPATPQPCTPDPRDTRVCLPAGSDPPPYAG